MPPPLLWIPVLCTSVDIFSLFPRERRQEERKSFPRSLTICQICRFSSLGFQKISVPCLLPLSFLLVSSGTIPASPRCSPGSCSYQSHKECEELEPFLSRIDPSDCSDAIIWNNFDILIFFLYTDAVMVRNLQPREGEAEGNGPVRPLFLNTPTHTHTHIHRAWGLAHAQD